ncbi:MAG TPA: class III extradiol ring-cleavage dioxygenase [Acetobacteraceae bacterium]|nr:class III extradiol ring-cleavage dioxygenase [Acetobacteraceae bacterium]
MPTLYLSHGSPMTAISETKARHFLAGLGAMLPRPRAILVVSAHWETAAPMVNAVGRNETIHDFFGFPEALFAISYPAPGAPEIAEDVAARLKAAGFAAGIDRARGLDHGAWVPLCLAYPAADIPVLQLSVQTELGPRHHLMLGEALAGLRAEGILVLGSGSFTHDLRRFRVGRPGIDAPETEDVAEFSAWMDAHIRAHDVEGLVEYRRLAPHAADEHPTEEHLLPLYVALGAAGAAAGAKRLHSSVEYGFLRMDAYEFA